MTPDGSLIYQNSTTGTITAGSVDAYSLSVAAGQTISVLVTPASGLQAQVNLSGTSTSDIAASGARPRWKAGRHSIGRGHTTDTLPNCRERLEWLDRRLHDSGLFECRPLIDHRRRRSQSDARQHQNIDSSFTDLGTTAQRGAAVGTLLPGEVGPDGFGYTGFAIAPQFVDISGTGKPILAGVNDGFQKLSFVVGLQVLVLRHDLHVLFSSAATV